MYTTYNGDQYEIEVADMDGENRVLLYSLPAQPQGMALDTATNKSVRASFYMFKRYVFHQNLSKIVLCTLPNFRFLMIIISFARLYWTLADSTQIMSGDLNRTEPVSFMTTVFNPTKITAHGDHVIWLETDGYFILFSIYRKTR